VRRHPRVVAAAAALVTVIVVVGALGGWARSTPEGIREVPPGEATVASPMVVTLDRAEATYEVSGRAAEPGRAYVVVEGTLAVDWREPVTAGVVTDTLLADLESTYDGFGNVADVAEPSVQVADDGSALLGMGPGLTYRVLLVYEIDEAAVPDAMTVVVHEHTWRRGFFDATLGWFDPQPVAEVTLPISPLPDERPPEEEFL
jgi:hypothetical protein